MNPRKFSTKDRERFGGISRAASSSSGLVTAGLGSEVDDEQASGNDDGSSSAPVSGLAAFDPSPEPVVDEHWETAIGESNKESGLGAIPTCSTLVMKSNASVGGILHGCALRVALTDGVNST
jgi:hypothetical protein